MLTRVVSDSPFRARELIDRLCTGTRDAFGFKRVEWHPPHELVPVAREGDPPPGRNRPFRADGTRRGRGRRGRAGA